MSVEPAPQTARRSAEDAARELLGRGPADARDLIGTLDDRTALAALLLLEPEVRAELLGPHERPRFAQLLVGRGDDLSADFLSGLPTGLVDQLLEPHPRAAELRAAVDHAPESVGAAMRRRPVLAVGEGWRCSEIVDALRVRHDARAADEPAPPVVCVVDDADRLTGLIGWDDLVLRSPDAVAGDVARPVVAVEDRTDQEEAVRLADQHRLAEIPVTDADGRLLGIVVADELRAIVRDEASEDIMALSGTAAESDPSDSPGRILRSRFPWLVSALVGALVAGVIIGAFEDALEQAVVLASLIPLVMDMAGNAGIQSSAVTIEAMASPHFWRGDTRARLAREFLGALLNGAAVAAVTGTVIILLGVLTDIDQPVRLALAASATLVTIIVQAALVGVLVPLLLRRLGLDPAVGTGVFITTINDFAGIAVLFGFASLLYLPYV